MITILYYFFIKDRKTMPLIYKFDCTECFKVVRIEDPKDILDLVADHLGHLIKVEPEIIK